MIVGVFCPAMNLCGGAEWIALQVTKVLKEYGHNVILLSDNIIDQKKILKVFGRTLEADQVLVFPLRLFSQSSNYHNIYTDALKVLVLKSKCRVLVDASSNAILPGMDVAYIHYPLLKSIKHGLPYWRNKFYFLPYQSFLVSHKNKITDKLIFANSKFTAQAVEEEFGVKPCLLYPPFSTNVSNKSQNWEKYRGNNVATVARISGEKNLEIIPYIAKLTSNDILFTIAGLSSSQAVLTSLLNKIKKLNVADKVKILTNVTKEEVRRILLTSRVFLHTKEAEHFGIAIVEAMSLGCIPVVHDSGGPREFVPEIFRFKSIEDAALKVEKAIAYWSPIQAKKMSQRTEKFNEINFSKRFIELFNLHFSDEI